MSTEIDLLSLKEQGFNKLGICHCEEERRSRVASISEREIASLRSQ